MLSFTFIAGARDSLYDWLGWQYNNNEELHNTDTDTHSYTSAKINSTSPRIPVTVKGSSNRVNMDRVKLIKKRLGRFINPLDWHLRRQKGNIFKTKVRAKSAINKKKRLKKRKKLKIMKICNKIDRVIDTVQYSHRFNRPCARPPGSCVGTVGTVAADHTQTDYEPDKDRMRYYSRSVLWELRSKTVDKDIAATHKALVAEIRSMAQNAACTDVIIDSGAMRHSGDLSNMPADASVDKVEPVKENLVVSGLYGAAKRVRKQFSMLIPAAVQGAEVKLANAIDIAGSSNALVSVGVLDDSGYSTTFANGEVKIFDPEGQVVIYGKKIDNLYRVRSHLSSISPLPSNTGDSVDQMASVYAAIDSGALLVAHEVLGHRCFNAVRRMLHMAPECTTDPNPVCEACCSAQMRSHNLPRDALSRASRYGFRIHADTSRKMPATTAYGARDVQRFLLVGDEFTDYLQLRFTARKSEVKHELVSAIDALNTENADGQVAQLRTDAGTEFVNKDLATNLKARGIIHHHSDPHMRSQSGWIESRMELIERSAKAMMYRANAPECDWPYAYYHSVYLHNNLPNDVTKLPPCTKKTGLPSTVDPKKLQGNLFCKCYAKVYVHGKLQKDAIPCIYLGKNPRGTSHLVRQIGGARAGQEVREAAVVKFEPRNFPYTSPLIPRPSPHQAYSYDSDSESGENGGDDGHVLVDSPVDRLSDFAPDSPSDPDDLEESDDDSLRAQLKDQDHQEHPDWVPDGNIDGQDAYEIEAIVAERSRRVKGRKKKFYQVKWKGQWPPDQQHQWVPAAQVRAPSVVAEWKQQRGNVSKQLIANLVISVYQMDQHVDSLPIKEESNPFKKLFDPTKQARVKPPRGYKAMLAHPFAKFFQEALLKEKMENLKWKTYQEVPRSQLPPHAKVLRTVTAWDIKYNHRGEIEKFKSRVCLDGSRTTVCSSETYENIAGTSTIRMLLCLAARYGLNIAQTDVKNFFLQAAMPEGKEYYAEIPEGWEYNSRDTHVAKVLAPWYGLKEAAKLAGDQLAAIMVKAGLTECKTFPKVFFQWRGDDFVACATHIDDALWIYSSKKMLDEILDKVDKDFKMIRTYNVQKLLGLEIDYDQDKGLMKLHQGSYVLSKLRELSHNSNSKTVRSPGLVPPKIVNPAFPVPEKKATAKEVKEFQRRVGIWMWSLQSDPSSMYVTHQLASKMLNPQKDDWAALARLERYKSTYPSMGVVFRRAAGKPKLKHGENLDCLTYFADADLAGDYRTSKSTSGFSVSLGDSGVFDWKSKRQTCVAQSSCESETYSAKECTTHAIWLRAGLSEMGFSFTAPSPICQDNQGAIALCSSDKHHSRTRHFRMHVALLKDCMMKRITCYPWIPTDIMLGDLYNKIHQPLKHEELCELNGIHAQGISMIPEVPKYAAVFKLLEESRRKYSGEVT